MRTKRIVIALDRHARRGRSWSAGIVTGAFGALARSGLYATGLWSPQRSVHPARGSRQQSDPQDTAQLQRPERRRRPRPVDLVARPGAGRRLVGAGARPRPRWPRGSSRSRSTGRVATYSGSVVDVGTGKVLFAHNAKKAYIPASTMKLLTSTAALSILGPTHRFTTTVVSPKAGQHHPGRRRRPLPGQEDHRGHLPQAGLDRRSGPGQRGGAEEAEGQQGLPRLRRLAVQRSGAGTRPGPTSTATR